MAYIVLKWQLDIEEFYTKTCVMNHNFLCKKTTFFCNAWEGFTFVHKNISSVKYLLHDIIFL
jgi:hypothetical protein